MTDWIEKARRRLGLEDVKPDPDFLPDFGEVEAENLAEKIYAPGGVPDKTAQNPYSGPINHSGDVESFRKPEEMAVSEKRTDKTDETIEPIESPSLTKLTKPEQDGRSAILEAAAQARPPDGSDDRWEVAMRGLRAFLAAGHGDAAEAAGWPHDELYRVPKLWSQISLCGCALLIGDNTVVDITPAEIRIKTASGATTAFYRKAEVDYALVFRERLRLIRGNYIDGSEEPYLRAVEHAVNVYRQDHRDASLEDAAAAVRAAIAKAAREKV